MFGRASSVAVVGIDGHAVDVEVQVAPGLPVFTIVGLPDASIQEARERVRAAVVAAGEKWPQQRVTVNLSPAHLPKAGSGFDLAIALAVLVATGRVPQQRVDEACAVGELSLDGRVRSVRGAIAIVGAAAAKGIKRLLVPVGNSREAALVGGVDVFGVSSLRQALRFLRDEEDLEPASFDAGPPPPDDGVDWAEVRGQESAKRGLEIAAAGGHNVLMSGSPGGGKTMLARRLPTILPPLDADEAMEVTRLYSIAGMLPERAGLITKRPFRAPHHSISIAGLVGGGSGMPMPGEVSLAHRGVLFLDEAGEFHRAALQAMRQPMEDGYLTLSRSRVSVRYPSRFQLVMATNPCPCGNAEDPALTCECMPHRVASYQERISGPLLDRVDVTIHVNREAKVEVFGESGNESSAAVRERIVVARIRQRERLSGHGITTNAEIPPRLLREATRLTGSAAVALDEIIAMNALSMRSAHRLVRVARTIADLSGDEDVHPVHVYDATAHKMSV